MYGFSHLDLSNSNTHCTFIFLILVLNKVSSFCNEAHTFHCQEVRN